MPRVRALTNRTTRRCSATPGVAALRAARAGALEPWWPRSHECWTRWGHGGHTSRSRCVSAGHRANCAAGKRIGFKRQEQAAKAQTRKPPAARTDIGQGAPISSPVTRASARGAGGTRGVGLHVGTWGEVPIAGTWGEVPWGWPWGVAVGGGSVAPRAGEEGTRGMGGGGGPHGGGGRRFSPARYGGTGREAGAA